MADGKLTSWDMKDFLWDGVHRIVLAVLRRPLKKNGFYIMSSS